MAYAQLDIFSQPYAQDHSILDVISCFDGFKRKTEVMTREGIPYFINEFWTARQRQSHNLHEISYRACFKAELPRFFIEKLTKRGERVYDPFMGRGTSLLEAALLGRSALGNDINPLSSMLIRPRLSPPSLMDVERRLRIISLAAPVSPEDEALQVFYHPQTLASIVALKTWLLERQNQGTLDAIDDWIRLVALNRLTGHSSGFFSVYSMPPNQAVSLESQRKINQKRNQVPDFRDIRKIILKKSRVLLSDGVPEMQFGHGFYTGPASSTPSILSRSVDLVVTSPPFLDIVNYKQDNWLRCWFAGIDPQMVKIDQHRSIEDWEAFIRKTFLELARIMRPGGHVAFEVGEVRGGKILLEQHVMRAIAGLPFETLGVMIHDQTFTKTANCWGVDNNASGTNTNRIVLLRRKDGG